MNPLTWWARRTLRLRVTATATVVLAVGLVLGTTVLSSLFFHSRVKVVDQTVHAELATVTQLVTADALPAPLPSAPGGTAFAQVLDAADTVLAATTSASTVLPLLPLSQFSHRLGHAFTTTASSLGTTPMRVEAQTATLHGVPVTVLVAVPFADVTSALDALRNVVVIVVPLVLLAAAAATWLAVGSALRPVDDMRAAADAVDVNASHTAPQLTEPPSGDELRRLGQTLNRMLRRLHNAGEQQRTFIADAAHELRSPIASVQTQLEVALATDTQADDWPVVAADVLADVQRLSRLADDLLLLARLDSTPPTYDDTVDLGKLVDSDGTSYLVEGNAAALARMLDNLCSNARRYATNVEVDVGAADSAVVVTVDDDGPGIAADDRERVFERWVRLDPGRSTSDGGSGLGLAIARSIARAHHGDITLERSPLGGLRVVISIPLQHA
ncbi:MAG TPA: HAMP domain-containing sensor histidine kinase [Acidothermaceae bacterium]